LKEDHHLEILAQIRKHAGKATKHTFLDSYLGNEHPRYAISSPALREIAKDWIRDHPAISSDELAGVLTMLIEGESGTEKLMAGILLDYSKRAQRTFDPSIFDEWLEHLVGWAEIDALCTGKYTHTALTDQWPVWKTLIPKFSKSENISKRRASLVLFCAPLRYSEDPRLAALALKIVDRLKHEKAILITKAISWVLRSMDKLHRPALEQYLAKHGQTLPSIALRETLAKLKTGRKTKKK